MAIIDLIHLSLLGISGIIFFILAVIVWRKYRQEVFGETSLFLIVMLFAASLWTFGNILNAISSPIFEPLLWIKVSYIGIILIPPSWMLFALKWTGKGRWFTGKKIFLPYIIPFFNIILVFTNSFHHLFWKETQVVFSNPLFIIKTVSNIGWWFHTFYSYSVLLIGIFFIIKSLFHLRNIYKEQALVLLIGSLFPWVANIFFIFIFPNLPYDPTPVTFLITGITFTWGLSHLQLIEVAPYAKEEIFEHLTDPTFVFDKNNNLLELNPKAEKIFQLSGEKVIGKKIENVFFDYPNVIQSFYSKNKRTEFHLKTSNGFDYYFNMIKTFLKNEEKQSGIIISFQDVTQSIKSNIALQKNEEKFRTFTESATIALMIHRGENWIY